jgi:hypothetical protein
MNLGQQQYITQYNAEMQDKLRKIASGWSSWSGQTQLAALLNAMQNKNWVSLDKGTIKNIDMRDIVTPLINQPQSSKYIP